MAVITIQIPIPIHLVAGDVMVYDTVAKTIGLVKVIATSAVPPATPTEVPVERKTTLRIVTEPPVLPGETVPETVYEAPSSPAPASYENTGGKFDRYRVLEKDNPPPTMGSALSKRRYLSDSQTTALNGQIIKTVAEKPDCSTADILQGIAHFAFAPQYTHTLWHYLNHLIDDGLIDKRTVNGEAACKGNPCIFRVTRRGREAHERLMSPRAPHA